MLTKLIYGVLWPILSIKVVPLYILKAKEQKQLSLCEDAALLLYYTTGFLYITSTITWDWFWYDPLGILWEENEKRQTELLSVIYLYFGYYAGLLVVTWWPPWSKDKYEMTIHHIATLLLMWVAWRARCWEISMWVLYINSIFDIFLGMSRFAYKMDWAIQNPLFGGAFLIHFGLRVCFYPYRLYRSWTTDQEQLGPWYFAPPVVCNIPLVVLNVYWCCLMTKVIYRRVWLKQQQVDPNDN